MWVSDAGQGRAGQGRAVWWLGWDVWYLWPDLSVQLQGGTLGGGRTWLLRRGLQVLRYLQSLAHTSVCLWLPWSPQGL